MATTKLADLYEPLTFNDGVDEAFTELNRFLSSGIMTPLDKLSDMASVGGSIGEMPFFKPLTTSAEPDYVDDDETTNSSPGKTNTGKQIWRLAKMHGSWSTMDFARELGLSTMDPLDAIIRKVGKWWAVQEEKRVIESANGILADNVANDAGDMIVDIYSDIATPLAANIIAAEDVIDTLQTSGDHQGEFVAIAMHSVTYSTLRKQNLIDFIPDSRGEVQIPYYLGLVVTVDDSLPVISGTLSPAYITVFFSVGAFGFGEGQVLVPSEFERNASAGKGGGEDIIHSRRSDIIHPAGFQFTSTSVVGESATLAELATATNWDRVVDRKKVGLAFLKHNN